MTRFTPLGLQAGQPVRLLNSSSSERRRRLRRHSNLAHGHNACDDYFKTLQHYSVEENVFNDTAVIRRPKLDGCFGRVLLSRRAASLQQRIAQRFVGYYSALMDVIRISFQ